MQVQPPVPEPARIALLGDVHSNYPHMASALAEVADEGAPVLVQVGDFGLWPSEHAHRYLERTDAAATGLGVTVLWLDGNHDDHDRLDAAVTDPGTGLHRFGESVWHLPRGARWTWHGMTFTAVGGATSLDRLARVPGDEWWPQEELSDTQADRIAADGVTDVLLSHDCPAGVTIPGIYHRNPVGPHPFPYSEMLRAWDHRDRMARLARHLAPTHLVHGHFHRGYSTTAQLAPGILTEVTGLACDGDGLAASYLLWDLAAVAEQSHRARGLAA